MPEITIIDDGDGPDNFDRGDKALLALKAAGYVPADATGVPSNWIVENYQISDLICDLLHLARRHGSEVGDMIDEGLGHFGSDCVEQAWKNDDGWDNCLQTADNLPRAEQILRANGVPEEHFDRVYRMTGLLPPLPRDEED